MLRRRFECADCDLFAGANDALTLLSHKIVPGTVILFDELINYNRYKENEVNATAMPSMHSQRVSHASLQEQNVQ